MKYATAFALAAALAATFAAALAAGSPAFAITAKEKMDICNFGASDQKLSGAARKSFITKCMAKGDEPGAKPKSKPKPKPAS